MHTYKIEVERDGRWWMINVPELDQLTQARRLEEVEDMALSLISISTGLPLTEIQAEIVSVVIPGFGDILIGAHRIEALRHDAEQLEAEASCATKKYAQDLTSKGIPVRDAATLLKVSPQRVSQLANSSC